MFVDYRFSLREKFKNELRSKLVNRQPFQSFIFYRTYSRKKADGSQESWADCVIRVIEGVMSIRLDWLVKNKLPYNLYNYQNFAEKMALSLFEMKWLPPGRGLWAMGTDYVYERGSAALYNCAFVEVKSPKDFNWIMQMLMCGVGVGFSNGYKNLTIKQPDYSTVYTIPDSREGWAHSVELIVAGYINGTYVPEMDYSQIRLKGLPIKGFGGVASGPEPLQILHNQLHSYFKPNINKKVDPTRLVADIVNSIGCTVVAGNIRRSAEIMLGSINDETFLNLKNYSINPDRQSIGWMSNNSVFLDTDEDFLKLGALTDLIISNGEPGIINRRNFKYGRVGKFDEFVKHKVFIDEAVGINPCQPGYATVLTPEGIKTFDDISIGSKIWSKDGWVNVVNKVCTGKKPVYRYITSSGIFIGTQEHRVVSNGKKVEIKNTTTIDSLTATVPNYSDVSTSPQDIVDGLVLGDGSVHKASNNLIGLHIGTNDTDYLSSEISSFILRKREGISPTFYEVTTTLTVSDLPLTYNRKVPKKFFTGSVNSKIGFLRGLFSANGSVVSNRVTLKSSSFELIKQVQLMLNSLGIISYITTNNSKKVAFANGTYTCRESYDLNISSHLRIFKELIGFIQSYKTEKLNTILATHTFNKKIKSNYDILDAVYVNDDFVYDITVDGNSHTYWSGGLDVSNCGEIPLKNYEVCNLSETIPTKCLDFEDWLENSIQYATFYSSTVSLLPTFSEETNKIVAQNRRIGVAITDFITWKKKHGVHLITNWLRKGYEKVREYNEQFANEAGVPKSIRVTTVKPSGTISKLAGVLSGAHHPTFNYTLRRVRVSDSSPIVKILQDANVPYEKDLYSQNTLVFEFPLIQGQIDENSFVAPATNVSLWEQASNLMLLQREWSDNAVSVTLYFNPETELNDLREVIPSIAPHIKSASFLPHVAKGVYAQSPEEGITKEEYLKRVSNITPIDWSKLSNSDGVDSKFCTNDSCEI